MKKLETLAAAMTLVPALAIAQQNHSSSKADTSKTKTTVANSSRILTLSQLDQRKIYHWANGQRGTPTGREAGENVSQYVKLYGDDSAVIVDPPVKK
jgi:Ni/Co efflux regulator RcnB